MAVIGCYTLDLYCDTGDGDGYGDTCPYKPRDGTSIQGEYTGQTEGQCIRDARRDGWRFNRDKTKAFCPRCNKENRQ